MSRRWAIVGAVLSIVATALGPTTLRAATAAVGPAAIVQDEAYWVSLAQLTCSGDATGAIAEARITGPGPVSVHPYEANIGARALVAAGPRYLPMVGAYIRWYLAHLNRPDVHGVTGTVYDYTVDPVTCAESYQPDSVTGDVPSYDSTDAYAGTFLSLVAAYARADPSPAALIGSPAARQGLGSIAGAILATRTPSGLTAAGPTYDAEFLLDNVEAQRGLQDYAWVLSAVFGDAAGSRSRAADAAGIRRAIETVLWKGSRTRGMYAVAADTRTPTWGTWYPDSFAQLWPVADRLGPADRRSASWRQFAARRPGWTTSTPRYGTVSVEHDPNAAVAYAASRVGDAPAVEQYLVASERNWADAGRPPPWTVDDSGFRALAALSIESGSVGSG